MPRLPLTIFALWVILFVCSTALPHVKRQTATKPVFAHFILGIVASYDQSKWEADMNLAKAVGIDAFALDIGKDSYNDQQLTFAYAAAEATGFKVFISFDFAYWTAGDGSAMAALLQKFGTMPGQFLWNNRIFVSSFVGDGFPYRTLESQSGLSLFACPSWQPGSFINNKNADCGMSWNAAWPNMDNEPIDANITTALDQEYITDLAGRPYMMPVSPWFNTHYGGDTFNKNWIFYSDWLFQSRWDQALQLQPQFIEILTWNDFGESHYIGPLHPEDPDVYAPSGQSNGAIKWVAGMPHDGWRDLVAVYIKAFKAGASAPTITQDELIYYYRPNPKNAVCSDPVGKPDGFQFDDDLVFVTAMLTSPGTVTITSGSNAPVSINVAAGVHTVSAAMGIGSQVFSLSRNGATVMTGTGGLVISNTCTANNFNSYVGTVTA